MPAAVAAGDRHTAEAAAQMLRRGGNAVDAAVAGAFAAFVAEPLLASPGGAGILTTAAADGSSAAVDFFSRAPGLGGRPGHADFEEVWIDFGPARQSFHVGRAAAAYPMALPGLSLAASRFGRLPLRQLVAPAVDMARDGVPLGAEGALVYSLLWPILSLSPEAIALAGGAPPRTGDRVANPELAGLLRELGELGRAPPRFTEAILRQFGAGAGGLITEADVEAATPRVVAPREIELGDWTALTSPRVGGALVAAILQRLGAEPSDPDEVAEAVRLAEACRAGHEVREALAARGSTTHISVIDAEGAAAAVTLTNGEGCGHVVDGTGVQLNNFLGEEDLNPGGFHRHAPGAPLPTMIAPTVALRAGRPAIALGSGGSNRIRSVVSQVLHRVCHHQPLEASVLAPRVHAERHDVWVELEGRAEPARLLERLADRFERVHPFERRAFFFGGLHAVAVHEDGSLHAFGDPRRGGATAWA